MDSNFPAVRFIHLLHNFIKTLDVLELSIVCRPQNGHHPCSNFVMSSSRIALCYIALHNVILHCITRHPVTLHSITSHYIMSYCIWFSAIKKCVFMGEQTALRISKEEGITRITKSSTARKRLWNSRSAINGEYLHLTCVIWNTKQPSKSHNSLIWMKHSVWN